MKRLLCILFALIHLGLPALAAKLVRVDPKLAPDLFVWTDTCNVFVLRDGETAVLIDLGDGSVLDQLGKIGVRQIDWVLFTHHHREQCQGVPRLKAWQAAQRPVGSPIRLGAPQAEASFFERPTDFRKMKVSLGDAFTIHGSSYVRPPALAIPLDRAFSTNDTFSWRGHEWRCVATPGNSPGSMTYLLKLPSDSGTTNWLAFSGDVMLAEAKMHTWYDTEWDYGFGAGIQALRTSVTNLMELSPRLLLPSHGRVVRDPQAQLRRYQDKLADLERLYVRGYGVEGASAAYQDKVSKPTVVTNVAQVSPHLFKFKRANFWPNFGLILADSGRALVVDCGLLDEKFLDEALEGMREHFGLKAIDAVIITHMHGDHFLEAPHLREKWGAKIWALDRMVDSMEHPEWFDYAAPIQAYGKKSAAGTLMEGAKVDRAFKSGESFEWEGYRFTIDWMPGQTEFALCLHGQIDGRRVAFTGDNIFGDPDDPRQTGHEAVVAHNSAILEEGYIYGAEYLSRLKPDIMVGGHSFVMDRPGAFIERYRKWAYEMRDAFQALSWEKDYRYWFDPFWLRAEPYRVAIRPGETVEVNLHLRNFLRHAQSHRIDIHSPPGFVVEPTVLQGRLAGQSREAFPIRIIASKEASPGLQMVSFDVTLAGRKYGQRFDMLLGLEKQVSR